MYYPRAVAQRVVVQPLIFNLQVENEEISFHHAGAAFQQFAGPANPGANHLGFHFCDAGK